MHEIEKESQPQEKGLEFDEWTQVIKALKYFKDPSGDFVVSISELSDDYKIEKEEGRIKITFRNPKFK